MGQTPNLSEQQVNQGLRYLLFDGGLATIMGSLCSGVFTTGFALLLGASNFQIGLLAALPMLADAAQPIGSYLAERSRHRRRLCLSLFGPGRSLWFLLVLLPYLGYERGPSQPGLYLLLLVATASAILGGFGTVSWMTWVAELVPEERRGRYFGARNTIAGVAGTAAALSGGYFIDRWRRGFGDEDPLGFFVLFGLGLICGILSLLMLRSVPETWSPSRETMPYLAAVRQVIHDRNFRRLALFRGYLAAVTSFVGPFFTVYMLKNLGLPYSLVSIYTAVNSLASFASMRWWGKLADHFGNRPVIIAAIAGAGVLPLIWLPTAGGHYWVIPVAYIVGGVSWGAIMLANFNMVLKISPAEHKPVYIGTFNAFVGLCYAIGPTLGGLFAQGLSDLQVHVGSWVFVNYHLMMVISGLLRLSSVFIMRRVTEPESARVTRMVQVLWHTRGLNPFRAFNYYRHVFADTVRERAARATNGLPPVDDNKMGKM